VVGINLRCLSSIISSCAYNNSLSNLHNLKENTRRRCQNIMKPIWIDLVNSGVANRFSFKDYESIEMNWRLTNYPSLYRRVFEHEIKHESGKYKAKDFIHDMKSKTPGLHKFMRNHISSWTQILPVYWDKKRKLVVYDVSNIFLWVVGFFSCAGIYYGLRWLL